MTPRPVAPRARRAAPRQGGYTLVETLITCLVVSIVLAAAFPVLPVFFRESNIVQNTYSSVDQLVLASEVVTRYVHEAVSPSATANPFLTASANTATFYANTGKATGPEKAVMQVATVGTARTFQLNLYPATANTCPGISAGTQCTYTASTQSFLLINYLTNGTAGSPVFTYTLQGGEVCAGPTPGAAPTTLKTAAVSGATTVQVVSLPSAVSVGDTIFLGSGPNAQSLTATAAVAASGSATNIPVTALTSAATLGTAFYDSATTNVPSTVPTTLKTTASAGATTVQVTSLPSAVSAGDVIIVGTGASAQSVTATSAVAASGSATNITITSGIPNAAAAGSAFYDSTCSLTQVSQITAVSMSLQATKNPGGQPTGYQSLAYMFSPEYSAAVG